MRHAFFILTTALLGIMLQSAAADACSSIKAGAQLETFECTSTVCNQDTSSSKIFTISGSLVLGNRRATPTLASLVVELEARIDGSYTTVARRVLNENGDDVIENCEGIFSDDPMPGRLVLVDGAGNPISFASVKNLPEGRIGLNYIASFSGAIPGLDPGAKVRVRTMTTAFNTHTSGTCSIDADNSGSTDLSVKTHVAKTKVSVPSLSLALMP